MKRFLMTSALAMLVNMPLAAMHPGESENQVATTAHLSLAEAVTVEAAPLCDGAKIAQYELTVKKGEYRKTLMRAGVYACVLAGASYLGYKFFTPGAAVASAAGPKLDLTSDANSAALAKVIESMQISFLSGKWFKNAFFSVRDMLIFSVVTNHISSAGSYLKEQLFSGKKIDDFYVHSTTFVRVCADLEYYAKTLKQPEYGDDYRSELQTLVKDRTCELCAAIEQVIAYMHVVRDGLDIPSKDVFVETEQFLLERTNKTLALLWQSATHTNKKSAELGLSIALTMALFTQDFARAVKRFDGAYVVATQAA